MNHESEQLVKALLASIQGVVMLLDRDGRCSHISINTQDDNWGLVAEQCLGKSVLDIFPPHFSGILSNIVSEAPQTPSTVTLEYDLDNSNTIRHYSMRLSSLRDSEGAFLGLLAVARRSDNDNVSQQMLSPKLLLAQKMEGVGVLAADVAHDFNNMLVGVMGAASMAKRLIPKEHSSVRYVDVVIQSADRAAQLNRQFLGYIHGNTNERQPINLNSIIMDLMAIIKRSVSRKIEIVSDLYDKLPMIYADPGQMQQMVMNLCINAKEAIGNNEGVLFIRTMVSPSLCSTVDSETNAQSPSAITSVLLEVEDTGPGIKPELQSRIFDAQFTTTASKRGLGLTAVRSIVDSHDGNIDITSENGEGALFRVYLPIHEHRQPEVKQTEKQGTLEGTETILVVDDERDVREMARDILETHGYTILVARNGKEALETYRAKSASIDLVLLDLSMPFMDGCDVFEQLLEIDAVVRVIMSSGYVATGRVSSDIYKKLSGFLQKPYDVDQLCSLIRRVLDGS